MSTDAGSPNPFLLVAIDAVRRAGEIQLAFLGGDLDITVKEGTDIVTRADLEVEAMFRRMIAERFPGHGVLAEEMAETQAAPETPAGHGATSGARRHHRWLFDPIDGTVNYAHGLPFFCASLALEVSGVVEVAAVFEPSRQELFSAERSKGAWLNGQAICVSKTARISEAALGTGFPHSAIARDRAMEELLGGLAIRARAMRRFGSAALDLCYVACGRLDGFWDKNLKAWDIAAGSLIVEEAGGTVTAITGETFSCDGGNVLASNGRLHQELAGEVQRALRF
ncbi:MAG TPA: inositol monophosphatase family protein [Vicinamibacterales bacterium]|jgi:myo-inositol-1(or 4)-monophosphatase|nr:inositol monophosphatase family protein [Vicinamibacterales bacterium]